MSESPVSRSTSSEPVVLAMTGASGAMYGVRLLQCLLRSDIEIHLTISTSGAAVIRQELGLAIDPRRPDVKSLVGYVPEWSSQELRDSVKVLTESEFHDRLHCHQHDDFMTPIASGSFRTRAMVICPCSGSTLSGIARAAGANLIQRAAEVHLKERRRLVLVPRETPLSTIQLENMHRLSLAGAVMLPAMPGWYHGVESLDSIVDFVVSRILDQLELDNTLMKRWGE